MLFITDKESYMQNGVICVGRYLLGYYFRWKHVTALACFIRLHSLKLQNLLFQWVRLSMETIFLSVGIQTLF